MASLLRQSTTTTFNPVGDRNSLLANGRFQSTSIYLSSGIGLAYGLDLWAQVPVHRMHYQDQGGERNRSGVGDVRLALRASPVLIRRTWPIAVRAGLKLPGSSFPLDATIIPLTEGQRDVEMSLESGGSLFGGSAYVLGWAGYRWRSRNSTARRKPGDEAFFHAAIGTTQGGVRLELAADRLIGGNPEQLGFAIPAGGRRLFQLTPTIGLPVAGGSFEFTSAVPLAGRNLPAGVGLSVGYRLHWGQITPVGPERLK
jgi:hypothetical protein